MHAHARAQRGAFLWGLITAICMLPSTAFACVSDDAFLPLTAERPSAPEAFVLIDPITAVKPFAMTVRFCDEGAAISDVTVDATMPAHRHGMNYQPDITNIGEQAFKAENLVFHMPGHWQLAVSARFDTELYNYTLDITVK